MERQQSLRQVEEPWEGQVYDWYWNVLDDTGREGGITTLDAYVGAVQKGNTFSKEMTKYDSMVVGSILRNSLKLERQRRMIQGDYKHRYYITKDTQKPLLSAEEVISDIWK